MAFKKLTFLVAEVAPHEPGAATRDTLLVPECNDCLLGRVLDCLKKEGSVEGSETLRHGATPTSFSSAPLDLNFVGLRCKGSASNKFDDRLVVFYRDVELSGGKVLGPEHYPGINAPAIEAFLDDSAVAGELLEGGKLPGKDSTDTSKKKPCPVHAHWRVLVYGITTDPGYQKKVDLKRDVPVTADAFAKANPAPPPPADASAPAAPPPPAAPANGAATAPAPEDKGLKEFLQQGRAVLLPGKYPGSHRIGVHHHMAPTGYVALSQTRDVTTIRPHTVAFITEKLETVWRKEYDDRKKAYGKAKPKYDTAHAKWQAKADAHQKDPKKPDPGPEPVEPTSPDETLDTWTQQLLQETLDGLGSIAGMTERYYQNTPLPSAPIAASYTLIEPPAPAPDVKPKKNAKPPSRTIKAALRAGNAVELPATHVLLFDKSGVFGINIHKSGEEEPKDPNVFNWSEGCQVFRSNKAFKQFRRLVELSKRARCDKRVPGAKDACWSTGAVAKELLTCDILQHQLPSAGTFPAATKTAQAKADGEKILEYVKARLTKSAGDLDKQSDANLDARFVDERVEDLFRERLQQRLDSVSYGAAATKKSTFHFTKAESTNLVSLLEPRVKALVDAKLLPAEEYGPARQWVGDSLGPAIAARILTGTEGALGDDAELLAKRTELSSALAAAAAADPAKNKKPPKQKDVDANAEKDPAFVELRKQRITFLQDERVEKLETELEAITTDTKDRKKEAIDAFKRERVPVAGRLKGEGLELCDYYATCTQGFGYLLSVGSKSDLDAIDARWAGDAP